MNVIVIGGGKVGFYLCKTLLEHGHQPLIIEKNKHACEYASQSAGHSYHQCGMAPPSKR